MQTRFAEGTAGSYLTGLRSNYGIETSLTTQDELTLPSAVNVSTREAQVVPPGPPCRGSPRWTRRTHDPALGLVVGVILGLVLQPDVPIWLQPYLPIAVIAALDAVFGAVRATLDGIFDDKVFVVSFLSNVVVAAFIVFLGDQLGVGSQLSTGVVVVLGVRIFSNVASIRRHLFKA